MDKNVLAGLALDVHFLSYLVLLDRLQPYNKKGQQVLLAAPLIESKGVTRATNATAPYHEFALAPNEFGSDP